MNDPEPPYAYSKGRRAHRTAAVVMVAVLTALFMATSGIGSGIRASAYLVFPLAGIWFADELAEYVSEGSGGWLTPVSAPVALRIACWFGFAVFAWMGLA